MATESSILEKIRSSTRFVTENARDVKVNSQAVESFLQTLDIEKFQKLSATVGFPVKFTSVEEEINFLATIDLLNFGSGFRKSLHQYCKRGAYETICYGLIGLFISGKKFNADLFAQIGVTEVSEMFGIPLAREKELMAAVTTLEDTECRLLADYITKVLNDTGRILRARNCVDLAQFVLGCVQSSNKASHLVEQLASVFPAFNDKHTYKGEEVYLMKKAQLLVADLFRRFAATDARFRFVDIDDLTVFSDNVLAAVLRKLGILELSEELAKHVDEAKLLKTGDQELELRATAVAASELIVERSKEILKGKGVTMNTMNLDFYLWTVGKEPEFRSAERHYTQDTVFY